MNKDFKTIAISRTDNIGDVVLTLPVAGIIRKYYPDAEILFIGKAYTKSVIETSIFVDRFIDRDEMIRNPESFQNLNIDAIIFVFPDLDLASLARKAGIKVRIGSFHKIQHLWNCTHRVNFTRRRSKLHESQLNFKLLKPLGIPSEIEKKDIPSLYGMKKVVPLPQRLNKYLNTGKFNLIIHPKSHGHGKEWPPRKYIDLCHKLSPDDFNIIFTGSIKENEFIKENFESLFRQFPSIHNAAGEMSLDEFVSFIASADGLLASGTGPLHVAAALGKISVGFFPPMAPVFSRRWENLGENAFHFELDQCRYRYQCREGKNCMCIESIEVDDVVNLLLKESKNKNT
ncbi:MAG: glycosyltransferase family 9 protein [Bacteroidota bacterium]|nr:glycosyltransferase family 9 protein [Bacteroidota bacterium]